MAEVRFITFQGRKTAGKALDTIDEDNFVWLNDVAVISKSKHGFIRVHSTWAQNDGDFALGISSGALTGAVIGALLGPAGAVAGAAGAGALAGGSVGGALAGLFEIGVGDPRLERFAEMLKDDTSALVLVGDEATVLEFVSVFGPFNGEVIETQLNEHDVKAIREALRADHARQ